MLIILWGVLCIVEFELEYCVVFEYLFRFCGRVCCPPRVSFVSHFLF
jgi:hypothetical protein